MLLQGEQGSSDYLSSSSLINVIFGASAIGVIFEKDKFDESIYFEVELGASKFNVGICL
jgi:hypothetical protein